MATVRAFFPLCAFLLPACDGRGLVSGASGPIQVRDATFFPGDLPASPDVLFRGADGGQPEFPEINFVRFRPPALEETSGGFKLSVPHIRLDRALQFLLGDRLA